ncbi:MAG: hypothetical protein V2A73_00945 [Pseudomonadota bacterium]
MGYPVFLGDGSDAFGAVRSVGVRGRPAIVVNVENAGDFQIPFDAIDKVVGQRVVVRWEMLDSDLQEAIKHVTDQEDFPPPGGEVELVPPPTGEEQDDSYAPGYEGPGTETRRFR